MKKVNTNLSEKHNYNRIAFLDFQVSFSKMYNMFGMFLFLEKTENIVLKMFS